ncbi:hypothetical protein NDU88_001659 [Pleurodeles waltl]|uniref:Uncharacterized protein n=1 Tax=Pleurodeles waltl TaxID=8319 RepID=A0AAV7W1N8_PLEWA|nr:hypothetical protein NDU88_001659 [Pleurodeles waltl]
MAYSALLPSRVRSCSQRVAIWLRVAYDPNRLWVASSVLIPSSSCWHFVRRVLFSLADIAMNFPLMTAFNASRKVAALTSEYHLLLCTRIAFPTMEDLAKQFGSVSGYKLNDAKTQILCTEWTRFNDLCVVDEVVYLGVNLTTTSDKLVEKK